MRYRYNPTSIRFNLVQQRHPEAFASPVSLSIVTRPPFASLAARRGDGSISCEAWGTEESKSWNPLFFAIEWCNVRGSQPVVALVALLSPSLVFLLSAPSIPTPPLLHSFFHDSLLAFTPLPSSRTLPCGSVRNRQGTAYCRECAVCL